MMGTQNPDHSLRHSTQDRHTSPERRAWHGFEGWPGGWLKVCYRYPEVD